MTTLTEPPAPAEQLTEKHREMLCRCFRSLQKHACDPRADAQTLLRRVHQVANLVASDMGLKDEIWKR